MKIEDTIELIGLPKPPDLPADAPMPEILNKNSFPLLSKQEFIDYVKFFPSMTLEEELEDIYANHNEINDISGVEHSLDDINSYSKEIRFYQCNGKSVLTSAEMPDVDFFIFVVIGSIREGFVGTCYCMTHAILEDIRSGKTNVEREVVNLCISKEQLRRMKELV